MKKKYQMMVTRPAWIQEFWEVELDENEPLPEKGQNIEAVRKLLEAESTVQLETNVSCHMDTTNTDGSNIHEDEYAEVWIDEFVEEEVA